MLVGLIVPKVSGARDGPAAKPAVGGASAESSVEAGESLFPQATAANVRSRPSAIDGKMRLRDFIVCSEPVQAVQTQGN